jgi:hypothetical protein
MLNLELCMLTCSHAHHWAFHGHQKTLRLTLEPWGLTLEPWRLTVEPCMLTQETCRLTVKPCMFTWGHSVSGSPWGRGCSHWTRRGSHWSLVASNWIYYGSSRGLRDSPWCRWGLSWNCGLWRLTISHKRFPNITHPCKCYVYIQYVHFSMSKAISHSQKK